MEDPYCIVQHRHNFAIWAAARAAQRGFASTELLGQALNECGIQSFASDPQLGTDEKNQANAQELFDKMHSEWSEKIISFLEGKGVKNVTYGRAAKLVNIYLKCMLVLPECFPYVTMVVHPPIDRILLQRLSKKADVLPGLQRKFKNVA